MPRSNRPRRNGRTAPKGGAGPKPDADADSESPSGGGFMLQRSEEWDGEEWSVRAVAGSAGKTYRCPGCDQEIRPGLGHLVTWRTWNGAEDRRHWHSACWNARSRRGVSPRRPRGGPPRY